MRPTVVNIFAFFITSILTACTLANAATKIAAEQSYLPKADSYAFGFSFGTNSSFSGKYWVTDRVAVDLGVEYLYYPWKIFYADGFWDFPNLFAANSRFLPYVGAGVGMGEWQRSDNCGRWHCSWSGNTTGSGTGFFVRGVLGLERFPIRLPRLGVYGELAPSYLLYPSGQAFDVALGARYYF